MSRESRQTLLSLLPVFIIAVICSLVIFITHSFTKEPIARNKQMTTIKMIETLMPLAHDNDVYKDKLEIPALSTTVYRARQNAQAVGLVFMPITILGYKDQITLAMGVSYDGTLNGVRIIEQHETPGLGDNIDQHKSDWIFNFDKRSLANTANAAWAVTNDGGDFDQLSGATISPRAVINAVKDTLNYYAINRDKLYK